MFKRKMKNNLPPDGRKYRLAILSMLVFLASFSLASLNPVLATMFPELITGILGLNLLYAGGNVGNKWVLGKNGGTMFQSGGNQEEENPEPI